MLIRVDTGNVGTTWVISAGWSWAPAMRNRNSNVLNWKHIQAVTMWHSFGSIQLPWRFAHSPSKNLPFQKYRMQFLTGSLWKVYGFVLSPHTRPHIEIRSNRCTNQRRGPWAFKNQRSKLLWFKATCNISTMLSCITAAICTTGVKEDYWSRAAWIKTSVTLTTFETAELSFSDASSHTAFQPPPNQSSIHIKCSRINIR